MPKKNAPILDCLKAAKRVLIAGHYHPDGDALGSTLALGLGLKALKKEVVCYNRDPVPFNLSFLPSAKELTRQIPSGSFDCAVMVDCAQPKRISDDFLNAFQARRFLTLVCIDHHLLDHPAGDIDWIEPKASSTGSVVWHLLKMLKIRATKEIANLVFCTLVVDTGSFRYSNTTAEAFQQAAELMRAGADPWLVSMHLEESDPVERYRLLAESLPSLEIGLGGEYASMEVTEMMLRKAGAAEEHSEEFANIPRSLRGVEVAALFREAEPGKVRVSLRSKERVDVSRIAKSFGGGGHEHAAGCNFEGGMEGAKRKIEEAVRQHLNEKRKEKKEKIF